MPAVTKSSDEVAGAMDKATQSKLAEYEEWKSEQKKRKDAAAKKSEDRAKVKEEEQKRLQADPIHAHREWLKGLS